LKKLHLSDGPGGITGDRRQSDIRRAEKIHRVIYRLVIVTVNGPVTDKTALELVAEPKILVTTS